MMKTTLMTKNLLKLAFVILLLVPNICFSEESDLNSAFNNYQKSYQSGDFEAAKTTLEEALKSHTHNSNLIYNLGLTEYKLGKVGLAIGLWRKALFINPQLNEARMALDYALGHMEAKPLAKSSDSTWIWLEKLIVDYLSFNLLWPLFLVCFFAFGYQFIKFLGAKKRAFANDEPSPILQTKTITLFMIAIFLGVISVVSYVNIVTPKAIVIAKTAEVKTGPGSDFATLSEIPEGTEVLIRDKDNQWYKIEDPMGRIGWADGTQVFLTNEL
jgi:tetratricopeptide (TPR) repeat protein